MSPERIPVFLARRSYRRRRVADAARLLPLAGGLLLCMPLLWQGAEGGARTVSVVIYVFALWVLLIVVSAVIARHLRGDEEDRAAEEASDSGGRE